LWNKKGIYGKAGFDSIRPRAAVKEVRVLCRGDGLIGNGGRAEMRPLRGSSGCRAIAAQDQLDHDSTFIDRARRAEVEKSR
jgi:hypothetical protein